MGKEGKVKTKTSKGAMRWTDDIQGVVKTAPDENGNEFDIRMQNEPDGMLAAKKIVAVLKEKGVCLVQANAPADLLKSAHDEAELLWEEGSFVPPLKVYDDRSMMESEVWARALADEEKVCWIKKDQKTTIPINALKLLAGNMADFGGGLGQLLAQELGIEFDRHGQCMLSCYTGERKYHLHLDNPHGCAEDENEGPPDSGLRLTCAYYINPHWDPDEGCEGGLDVCLTNPKETPPSSGDAKNAGILRVAPHADTMVLFLSERMAHQVIATKGKEKWFCMNMWYMNGIAMQEMPKKLLARRQAKAKAEAGDDSD